MKELPKNAIPNLSGPNFMSQFTKDRIFCAINLCPGKTTSITDEFSNIDM